MLNQKREQFLQRQAALQARTAKDAASRKKKPQSQILDHQDGAAAASGMASLQRSNWLADTDKYQEILKIQRMPVFAQIKRIIELLEKKRRGLTAQEIGNETFVDIDGNAEIQTNLRKNPKIKYDGLHYYYKAKHELSGKDELLHLIRERKDGIPFSEVKDSYLTVESDVQVLKAAKQVWVLQNSDTSDDILYPNDPRIQISVDDDIKALFKGIKLPDFQDIDGELRRAGMVPATNASRRATLLMATQQQRDRPNVKKRRESKRTKYTNSHLPDLLRGIEMPPGM